jgi:hypothetical protein
MPLRPVPEEVAAHARTDCSCHLSQHSPAHRSTYPASSKLCIFSLLLCPHKETSKLLGGNPRRPRSTERVEDEVVALPGRGDNRAAEETQGLLGGMIPVTFLPPWHGRDAPDGGDLCRWVWAVYEVVVSRWMGVALGSSATEGQKPLNPSYETRPSSSVSAARSRSAL